MQCMQALFGFFSANGHKKQPSVGFLVGLLACPKAWDDMRVRFRKASQGLGQNLEATFKVAEGTSLIKLPCF